MSVSQIGSNGDWKLQFFGQGYKVLETKKISQHLKNLLKMSVLLDIDQACNQKDTEGNTLHCTKRVQNKT